MVREYFNVPREEIDEKITRSGEHEFISWNRDRQKSTVDVLDDEKYVDVPIKCPKCQSPDVRKIDVDNPKNFVYNCPNCGEKSKFEIESLEWGDSWAYCDFCRKKFKTLEDAELHEQSCNKRPTFL